MYLAGLGVFRLVDVSLLCPPNSGSFAATMIFQLSSYARIRNRKVFPPRQDRDQRCSPNILDELNRERSESEASRVTLASTQVEAPSGTVNVCA
jgi:hypothetical protein